jgi:hypothetical protein
MRIGVGEQLGSPVEDGFDLAPLRLRGQVDKIGRVKLGCGEIERGLGGDPGVRRRVKSRWLCLLSEEYWGEVQVLSLIAPSQLGESGQYPGTGDHSIDLSTWAHPGRRQQREQSQGILVEIGGISWSEALAEPALYGKIRDAQPGGDLRVWKKITPQRAGENHWLFAFPAPP